ncbi:MAG: type secretion system secreted protein Hcp [Actinomycetota bacterium]|jgi:type VI secretion system secreted protein Hcp|nr:type secretion system secreted protein Hcp [Actinomycetota bacterium]
MASDYFLKLEGIKGESQNNGSPGAIEISSFSWGVSQSSVSSGAGSSAGKASVQPMRFVAPSTAASAALFKACVLGQHLQTATFYVRAAGSDGTSTIRAQYTLYDCLVSEYFVGGPADDAGTGDIDTFSLSFRKVQLNVTGPTGATGSAGWDLASNKGS